MRFLKQIKEVAEDCKTKNIKIGVYNTFGQEIYNKQISSFSGHFEERIDFSGFGEGIYILNIIYRTFSCKLFIQSEICTVPNVPTVPHPVNTRPSELSHCATDCATPSL